MNDKILDSLSVAERNLKSKQLKVGFMEGATYPDGQPVTAIASLQEYGNLKIPPRPFFRSAIANKEEEWKKTLTEGMKSGDAVDDVLAITGEIIKGDIVESIASLYYPTLAQHTIERRRARGNYSTKPLVDTKVLIRSVDMRVENFEPEFS